MDPLPHSQAWRTRADECRAAAALFQNDANRSRMLKVADVYERMAFVAAQKELVDAERARRVYYQSYVHGGHDAEQ